MLSMNQHKQKGVKMANKKTEPDVVITITGSVIKMKYETGAGTVEKRVSAEALSGVFSGDSYGSGVLPRQTVFYSKSNGEDCIGVYVEPRRYTLTTATKTYDVPMPPFLFVGQGRSYSLFALKTAVWPTSETELYYPPLSNIFQSCQVCAGNNQMPICNTYTIWSAYESIFESIFTPHVVAGRCVSELVIYDLWSSLESSGADLFPVDELVPVGKTVRYLM